MVGLAAFVLGRLWSWRGRTGQAFVTIVVMLLAVAEARRLPAALAAPPRPSARLGWVRYLRTIREVRSPWSRSPTTNAVDDYEPTTVAMLAGLEHGHPIVNGYSGFFPAQYFDAARRDAGVPRAGLTRCRSRGPLGGDRRSWLASASVARRSRPIRAHPCLLRRSGRDLSVSVVDRRRGLIIDRFRCARRGRSRSAAVTMSPNPDRAR